MYTESKAAIQSIRNKYGEIMFRMAISHLMDVGIRHLTEESVNETCDEIMQQDDSKAFMTNEFQCNIVRAAYELTQVPHTDLLVYIQREVAYDVADGTPSYERAVHLLKSCLDWLSDEHFDMAETLDTLRYIGFDDDELVALGFEYILDVEDENES